MAPTFSPPDLPITGLLPSLGEQLRQHDSLILEAPPGAGKTTLVPLSLLDQPWLGAGRILVLEPRRVAARAAARRMASLLGEDVGATVGFRVRQESAVSRSTRIEVITEGILNRLLLDDPALANVAAVIFDEFHERSLDADTGLALTLQGRALFREADIPLKVIVMSATLNGEALAQLLPTAPVVRSEGQRFPVTLHYGDAFRFDDDIVARTADTVVAAHRRHSGNLLVFLPGRGEIERVQALLTPLIPAHTQLLPLYGALPVQQQQRALEPTAAGQRRIVLATDIAESSLTIEGVDVVVDSGLRRQPAFDPNSGMTRLQSQRISQDSSEQRAGRAGRLGPGHCYRLWSEQQQSQLAPHRDAEILHADLAPLLLQLLAWGVDDMAALDWLDLPPLGATRQALDLLQQLEAIESRADDSLPATAGNVYRLDRWRLSSHGQSLATLPIHPRLAHMLVVSRRYGCEASACSLAALMSEHNPLSRESGADLGAALQYLERAAGGRDHHRGWRQRIRQQSRQFQQLLRQLPAPTASAAEVDDPLGLLVASAYPERIARRRQPGTPQYQLASGRIATLHADDPLITSDWLAIAEAGGIKRAGQTHQTLTIFSAVAFAPALLDTELQHLTVARNIVEWDDSAGRFIAERQTQLGKLVVAQQTLREVPEQQKTEALLGFVRKRGLALLPWTDSIRQWRARIALLRRLELSRKGDSQWPDLSDQALLDTLPDWLGPHLNGVQRLADFNRLDLANMLRGLLPWPLPSQLQELAPATIQVPSGLSHTIDYLSEPPVLRVKLQEMFGSVATPTVAGGQVPLMIHLLSPAGRPLQITQDLGGFWRSGYTEVKKEMKGRYPKHPWPDDPTCAVPTRATRHRRQPKS